MVINGIFSQENVIPVRINSLHPGSNDIAFGKALKAMNLLRESVWMGNIVGVRYGEEFAFCNLAGVIQAMYTSLVSGPQKANPGITKLLDNFSGSIDRTVVHNDQLEIRITLFKHAADTSAEVISGIVYGHDDGEALVHAVSSVQKECFAMMD